MRQCVFRPRDNDTGDKITVNNGGDMSYRDDRTGKVTSNVNGDSSLLIDLFAAWKLADANNSGGVGDNLDVAGCTFGDGAVRLAGKGLLQMKGVNLTQNCTVAVKFLSKFGVAGEVVRYGDIALAVDGKGMIELLPAGGISTYDEGRWEHITLVSEGPRKTLYHNGYVIMDGNYPLTPGSELPDLTVGKGFVGFMSDLYAWTRPLNADEVKEIASGLRFPFAK
jgi:hypothetical protein